MVSAVMLFSWRRNITPLYKWAPAIIYVGVGGGGGEELALHPGRPSSMCS